MRQLVGANVSDTKQVVKVRDKVGRVTLRLIWQIRFHGKLAELSASLAEKRAGKSTNQIHAGIFRVKLVF